MQHIIKCSVVLILFIGIFYVKGHGLNLPQHIAPETSAEVQEQAAYELIQRVVGNATAKRFAVEIDKSLPFRSFKISKDAKFRIQIIGYDGISIAKGFHYYLKNALNLDVSWFRNAVDLDANSTLPELKYSTQCASQIVYYQNVCTWSYSFVWWKWSDWQRHIDWMAMMGISLTLAPVQEIIWYDFYKELGLTEAEIMEHFAGPAFQAWQRMGNIRGWAGPLPEFQRSAQFELQKRIIEAQRALGMSIALPAFAGHVPRALQRLYPNVSFTPVERWNNFPDPYCCGAFLEPSEPLFTEIGTRFLRRIIAAYGTNHIYFSDPFNEVNPRLATTQYVNATAAHIYDTMQRVDVMSIWLLQNWMFVHSDSYWKDDLIKSFLTAVPIGRMLVLDLQSEQFPQYQRTYSYYGQPFIWCLLSNFGGTLGHFGSVDVVNTQIRAAQSMPKSSKLGVGLTPEGINQNYALYAFTLERAWSSAELNVTNWFHHFALTRYGGAPDTRFGNVWQLLHESVYSYKGLRKMRGKYTITRRPAFNYEPWIWYNATDIQKALAILISAHEAIPFWNDVANANYAYDLVDLTRQFLQNIADHLYVNLKLAFRKHRAKRYAYIAALLLEVFDDLEEILASNEHFLLGNWLESAKNLAIDATSRRLFEFNARNQITTWGPNGQILDYATKQWSGIVRDYYRPRWALFLHETQHCLDNGVSFNSTAYKLRVAAEIEQPFSWRNESYPISGNGNSYSIARRIYDKWMQYYDNKKFLHYQRVQIKLLNT